MNQTFLHNTPLQPGESDSRREFLGKCAALLGALWTRSFSSPAPAIDLQTAYLYSADFLKHDMGRTHPESAQRLSALDTLVRRSGLIKQMFEPQGFVALADTTLQLVHTPDHIRAIGLMPSHDRQARLAAGAAIHAVDLVCTGKVHNAFCAIRPPGHHATNTGREEGFCFFNNIALAARYAQIQHGLKKILIVDWDFHHGNGTEEIFYDDPSVLFYSTHNLRSYPGTGARSRTGSGLGKGFNINVPLGCGATDRDLLKAWDKELLPRALAFKPELVLISAGFDSRENDPLGCFKVTDTGFAQLTRRAMTLAQQCASGRLVSMLEGGYNPPGLSSAAALHVQTLMERL